MPSNWRINASARSLENWERWIKIRREGEDALSNATGRKPGCLLMNRDSVWELRRQKEVLLDAQKIKEYQCKCGKSGCPLFWKTTLPLRPCGKSLLAEAYFAPLKLTHENSRLSHIVEEEYIGLPECLGYRDEPVGASCLETSLDRWNKSPYVKGKKNELFKEIQEVEGFIPEVNDLVIVGTSLEKPKPVEVKHNIPTIIIEEVAISSVELDDTEPILQIGPFVVRGSVAEGIVCRVAFAPVVIPQTHARDILIANRGAIAIEYSWHKDPWSGTQLPLTFTKNMVSRFFFNKCDGILLPGQSFHQRFFFKPRTAGLFREIWRLETVPKLHNIKFVLEGVASKNLTEENEHFLFIENYLNSCVKRTLAHEIAQSILHQSTPTREENTNEYSGKFLEKEIFNHINPILDYDMDTIREVKELYSRHFTGKWNFRMSDLCDLLLEKLKDEEESTKSEVMNTFLKLYGKLQKKSTVEEIDENDWEMLKYDLCYMLLCTAVGQMEKCLRLDSWGLPYPARPRGPKGEYTGEMFEVSQKADKNITSIKKGQPEGAKVEEANSTEEEEDKLLEEEEKLREGLESVNPDDEEIEEFTFNVGRRIDFDGSEEICLASRRWPENFNPGEQPSQELVNKKESKPGKVVRKDTKEGKKIPKSSLEKGKEVKRTDTKDVRGSAMFRKITSAVDLSVPEIKPEVYNFHRAFVILHWRNILERTVDNVAEVVDLLNSFRGEPGSINPRLTERLHHSCNKHTVIPQD